MPGWPLQKLIVLIRGAGEMATGVAHRLHRSGLRVVMTEIGQPLAVRRAVSFCEAVHEGEKQVEGITARRVRTRTEIEMAWNERAVPVLVDPQLDLLGEIDPPVIVDALLAKRNTGLNRTMARLTIGLGPGFIAPDDVHVAVETHRGHDLGRLIYAGSPIPDTGVPGEMGGHTVERLLRSPADGIFKPLCNLGDSVQAGQPIAHVAGVSLAAPVHGVLRGLIRPDTVVTRGLKVGDVDPRGRVEYLNTISDKARAIGGSVLEAVMAAFNPPE